MTNSPSTGRFPEDGRQSAAATAICRGAQRCLYAQGFTSITEITLANGRRADIVALSDKGEIWIVEVKSSIVDFRTDQKWPEYEPFTDRLLFAVAPGFPIDILPETTGILVADAYGGEIIRPAPPLQMAAARRKAMTLRIARAASHRLQFFADPDFVPDRLE